MAWFRTRWRSEPTRSACGWRWARHNRTVLKLVIGRSLRLTSLGVGAGLLAALGLTEFLSSMLFGVGAFDPITLGGVALLLALVATLASYIPARRAMKVDPVVALRNE